MSDDLRALGDAVRAHRKALGVSQRTLAAWAATDQVTVSRIERGSSRVSDDTFARVLGALGISLGDLHEP